MLTAASFGLAKGIEQGLVYAAERYLTKVVGSRLASGLLSEKVPPMEVVNAVKQLKALGYTDDVLRELADNISASQLVRLSQLNSQGLSRDILDVLMLHSRKLGSYSDDLIWKLEKAGGYYDDILRLVDDYGEVFVHQLDTEELTRLGRLAKEGLPSDVAEALIKHIDSFADYSDDTIKKIVESGCNADRILTQIDEYAKDFTEDLTAGQLKRVDDILEQGITPEQFEALLQHADGLENYTDEIVELWRNYEGNSDDFLKLVDAFGEEFVEAFKANGDEAVENFKYLLENGFDSSIRNKFNELLNSSYYKDELGYDCSEIADDFLNAAAGRGKIYRIEVDNGFVYWYEYGTIEEFYYHEVYSDGIYIYDPRYSNQAILKDDYFREFRELNLDGFEVFETMH